MKNRHGFTLVELLIVVAIIAILVAIAVPVLNGQLEKAKEATDIANIRNAYSELLINMIEDDSDVEPISVPLKQSIDGWIEGSTHDATLRTLGNVTGSPSKGGSCDVSWDADQEKVLFAFNGLRIDFPDDNPGFGKAYAELVSKYIQKGYINNAKVDSKMQDYNGHSIVNISTGDGNFKSYIVDQATEENYSESIVNLLGGGVWNRQFTAYFDEGHNLLGYTYKQDEIVGGYSKTMTYLKDANDNVIISDVQNNLGDVDLKTALANYCWTSEGEPISH